MQRGITIRVVGILEHTRTSPHQASWHETVTQTFQVHPPVELIWERLDVGKEGSIVKGASPWQYKEIPLDILDREAAADVVFRLGGEHLRGHSLRSERTNTREMMGEREARKGWQEQEMRVSN